MLRFTRMWPAVSLLGTFLTACQDIPSEMQLSGTAQGTTYHFKLVTSNLSITSEKLKIETENILRHIDETVSNWREDSEISRFNRQNTTDWFPVSPEIIELLAIANKVHSKTGGCYDLTVQPLFELWGFSKHTQHIPSQQDIQKTLLHVGMDKLDIAVDRHQIRKKDRDLTISFDSIAQGYTVGAIANYFERQGIQNYLVELGGEMKVKGKKANGQPWRVAIEKPVADTRSVQRILDIGSDEGISVMTSGTYRNFFESNGETYSHILDPRTGYPVSHHVLSTTVLHNDPTWADAWSTGLLCVGENEAIKLAVAEGLKTLIIYHEEKHLREWASPNFPPEK